MSLNEESFPFKSIAGDRKYKAEEWRNVMRAMFSNGVFPTLSQLQVTPGTGMSVVISPGRACIDGVIYTLKAALTVYLTAADGVLSRKDKIIITVDESARDAYGAKLDGTPSASPSEPSNRWTSSYKDICLAVVTVSAGLTSVGLANISDKRTEPSYCGIAAPYLAPDTGGWYAAFEASFNAWMTEQQTDFDVWFSTMVATLDENAAANLLNLINANKAELEADIAAITPAAIGAEKERLVFSDQSITTSGWATFTEATGEELKIQNKGFIYRKSFALTGVLATMDVFIIPSSDIDDCGTTIQSIVIPYDGGVKIYAKSVPTAAFTLLRINCMKAGG